MVEDRLPALTAEEWLATTDWTHDRMWEAARQTALAEAEAAASRLEVPAEVSATVGDPGHQLRALSKTVDLMVVGSRRWGPVARRVSGGVGETLVADANCSIVIVPPPAARLAATAWGRTGR